jgi:2-C-methyl-D-erythritol 4-phosphate cytidylyltransferase
MKTYGIILASGSGNRYGGDIPKQFVKVAGKTVFEHTISIFEEADDIDEIIVVVTPEYRFFAEELILKNRCKKVTKLLNGGASRRESSSIGVFSIKDEEAKVVIHDCARPFLSQRIIKDCVKALEKYDAVDVAIPSADTIIKINGDIIESIPERKFLQRGQTPQCFKLSVIKKAHELAKDNDDFTDDCGMIVGYQLGDVYVVKGDGENIKITYPEDIYMADRLFQMRNISCPESIDLSGLRGRNIVIFGGTSGIGKCIAELAEANGANVFIASTRTGCDIRDYNKVSEFLSEINSKVGRIDYVVNSAGVLNMGKLVDRDIESIREDIEINYIGSINVCKAAVPLLRSSHGSLLLFTSSSYTRGRALYSTYSSSKAAIVNLVQAMSEELSAEHIRINALNPERTATPMRTNAFGAEPADTLLSPEKAADAALKTLLSDLSGQVISVRK